MSSRVALTAEVGAMHISTLLAVLCVVLVTSVATPVSHDDHTISAVSSLNTPSNAPSNNNGFLAERSIEDSASDSGRKRISLRALTDTLENSLYRSALSVSDVIYNKEAVVPEMRPTGSTDPLKEQTHSPEAEATRETEVIVLQTTEKVPETNHVPAHIIIDRISIQPHREGEGLPMIPAFQIHRTKLVPGSDPKTQPSAPETRAADVAKINIAKTAISAVQHSQSTTLAIATMSTASMSTASMSTMATGSTTTSDNLLSVSSEEEEPTTEFTKVPDADTATRTAGIESTTTATTTTTTTTTLSSKVSEAETSTTTKLPIERLKEAEKELKEKVAEIEAEPVILSARV